MNQQMNDPKTTLNPFKDKRLFDFTHGIHLDVRLYKQEIEVQKSWVTSLLEVGAFSQQESEQILKALDEARVLMDQDLFVWQIEDEDIHMNLERFLVEKLGDLGKRIHLGRSRNDLIATTLKLFVQDCLEQTQTALAKMLLTLSQQAETFAKVIVPGMTHLQHGQPIRFGHMLSAHGWAFARDLERLQLRKQEALAVMPLGSAALAGTTLKIDLQKLAERLHFQSAPLNSYDAVGDRDFILEGLHCFSLIGVHLSRLAEDFIIWSSTPVGLVRLPAQWSTGSSIMPNKRNPDVPELIRAKSAHLIAASTQAQILLKGLPSSYQSDLHELKRIWIQTYDEVQNCLDVFEKFLGEFDLDQNRALSLLRLGNMLATEIANGLAKKGVPFREAYQQTATLVEIAEKQALSVEDLGLTTFLSVANQFDPNQLELLNYETAVEERSSAGGTSLSSVLAGISQLKSVASRYLQ